MEGIGKTTLAQVVYNDYDVVSHFDLRMWVWVGEDTSIDRILKSLLECLTYIVPDKKSGREGILWKLLDRLKGKKYLLVLDDVWQEDPQLTGPLKDCLLKLGGSRGSKILVTTRLERVAELTLREMTSLEKWSEPANLSNHSSSVCPLLQKFEVEQCPKLKCLPNVMTTSHRLRRLGVAMCDTSEKMQQLKHLDELDICYCPLLVASAPKEAAQNCTRSPTFPELL
ncbi:unnamed protein product [Coffea canephora]|uniref:NB-ARC domain-containing protein n=1 Tax=Coffea canephora TaxID=49390 RepID=A0A068USE2_COFCA|nr:unnamed protein product [Coffea canephora]